MSMKMRDPLPIPAMQHAFNPYVNNEGTCIGIAGKDYAIVAGDTRMSSGYSIMCRTKSKVKKLTDHVAIASAGMAADVQDLHCKLEARMAWFVHQHRKQMPLLSVGQLLSNTLYTRRFFPMYAFNILGGIDKASGEGYIFGYDSIGSMERKKYSVSGSGQQLVTPLLDNQIGKLNQLRPAEGELTCEQAVDLIKDAFTSAGERDIYTGDFVDIAVVRADGTTITRFSLKDD